MPNYDDRWLLPSRQSDLPGRAVVAAPDLHARREGSFLALASLFLLATLALPLWFASSWVVDLNEIGIAGELTIGVLVFPVALIVGQLVCELYGARRASMLVLAGTVASIAIVAGEYATVDGYPLALALSLIACTTVTNAVSILVFSATSRALDGRAMWLRSFLATPVALLIGWAAFAGMWAALGGEIDDAVALASSPALYACACALVGIVPLAIARAAFGAYLRIGGREAPPVERSLLATTTRRLPKALIVDTDTFRKPASPYTTGEMRFFAEGDALADEPLRLD